jgi:hypothetical protein
MKHARLLTAVAAGLLLSTSAFAQAPAKDSTPANPAPAPAAQQNAPPEKTAPGMKAGKPDADTHKAPATTGQAPAAQNAPQNTAKPGNPDKAVDKGAMDNKAAQGAPIKPSDANGSSNVKPSAAQNAAPDASPKAATTTGQGAASGSAKLSTEQRTKITTVFKSQKVERIEPSKLNISISVGARVPSTVKYHPIPQEVVVIYPEWRGYDYILVGDQIIVLQPGTHEIVAVLDA